MADRQLDQAPAGNLGVGSAARFPRSFHTCPTSDIPTVRQSNDQLQARLIDLLCALPGDRRDPFLFVDRRGHFHILAHIWSHEAYPLNPIAGHAFSEDGFTWTFSSTQPYSNMVVQTDGSAKHFATLERPKLLWGDASVLMICETLWPFCVKNTLFRGKFRIIFS